MNRSTPLSSLAPGYDSAAAYQQAYPMGANYQMPANCPPNQQYMYERRTCNTGGANWAWVIIVFIIIVIIIWLLLWAFKPTWVQKTTPCGKPTGEIDNGKALLWAIVIAIIICIIIWIIAAAASW